MGFNKKGMMDDLFDFVFTVTSLFFLLFFLSIYFTSNVIHSHEISTTNIADFKRIDAALNNLQLQSHEGFTDPDNIDSQISSSNIWNGKVITTCHDYNRENDCNTDPMGKGGQLSCEWSGNSCYEDMGSNEDIMIG